MKIDESILKDYLSPLMATYKQKVISIYPNATFFQGYIYDGRKRITETRWNISGIESEYYAWAWAYQDICDEMIRKLES